MKTSDIIAAVALLRAGKLVAIPTETVYGLGADASNEAAIRRIFKAKNRPHDHPLIVHIASVTQLTKWARDIPPAVQQLAAAFWPGPLTLILKKQAHVLDIVTGSQDTIGLRIPSHPIAQAVLQAFGGGVAAPSANQFTHISPTTADAVREELGDQVDLILDGGDCTVGLESTIVDLSHDEPVILRPGMISAQMLSNVLGTKVISSRQDVPTRAPGMHHLHYAPTTKTQVIETKNLAHFFASLQSNDLPIAFVTHNAHEQTKQIQFVRMPHSSTAYAHDLYRVLRDLDHQHYQRIIIEAVPEDAEWDAIRDRLNKASGSH
jgi:L-threonylcarbamoyladenylate synthase